MRDEPNNAHPPTSAFRGFLAWAVGLGTCLVIVMATLAFGASGFGFGIVIALLVFGLMIKRYRFSLRTFFILTTILGIWLGLKIGRDRKLQRAITTITNAGGHLAVQDRTSNFPWGIWESRYDLSFYSLRTPLTHEQFRYLESFGPSSVRQLDLKNTGLADDDLKFVSRLTNVETLLLSNETYSSGKIIPNRPQNEITDAGLERLRGLKKLVGIQLNGTDVTDECVKYLSEMPHLGWIYLNGTHVTGVGMAQLGGLNELCTLELNGCPISPDGVKELSQLTNLMTLGLVNTGIKDADLDALNALPQIDILRLDKNQISDEAIKRFSDSHPKCTIERW